MLRDPSRTVDHGFVDWARVWVIDYLDPARIGARAGVEQSAGRADEGIRTRAIQPDLSREAKVRERVPTQRSSLRGGAGTAAGEKGSYGNLVGEDRRSVNAARRDVRILGEDHLCFVERSRFMPVPRRAGGFDECRDRVVERVDFAAQPEGLDVPGELWPSFETMFAGDDELRIGEPKGREADGI